MNDKRTVMWVPECFKRDAEKEGDPAVELYRGHLVVKIPKSIERMDWVTASGALDISLSSENSAGAETQLKLAKAAWHLIVGVEVERVSDGAKISTLEDLEFEEGLKWLPLEFGKKVLSGFGPGNG